MDIKRILRDFEDVLRRIVCLFKDGSGVIAYLFLAAAALSRCLRFLNQFPTCVGFRPVAFASSRFFVGFG